MADFLESSCFGLSNDTNFIPLRKQSSEMEWAKLITAFLDRGEINAYFLKWTSRWCIGIEAVKKFFFWNAIIPSSFAAV